MPFIYTDDSLLNAIDPIVDNEDYWMGDEVHVPMDKWKELKRQRDLARAENGRARDLVYLNKTVHEVSQSAANPRPLCTLLHNLVFTQMREPGMPGYQNSPQIRLVLHQLLWLLDGSALPAYEHSYDDTRRVDYGADTAAVERLYKHPDLTEDECLSLDAQEEYQRIYPADMIQKMVLYRDEKNVAHVAILGERQFHSLEIAYARTGKQRGVLSAAGQKALGLEAPIETT